MLQLARGGFTDQQIKDALHGKRGTRKVRFRYDLLDKTDKKKKELTNVLSGEVSYAALNDIKRTAKFSIVDDGTIDFLSDRIQPFYEINMPKTTIYTQNEAFSEEWNTQPYTTANMTVNSNVSGVLNVTSTTTDPNINMYNIGSFDPNKYRYIQMRYRVINAIATGWEIFYTNDRYTTANGAQTVMGGNLDTSGQWAIATIDMWAHPDWKNYGNIKGWRFDWARATGVNMEIDYIKLVEFSTPQPQILPDWISFPLGVFLLASPTRNDTTGGNIREVDAYDGTIILNDDKFDDIYTVTTGTNYKTAIITLLQLSGITKYIIEDTTKTLPIDLQFEPGTDKLSAVNQLLSQINFTPIRVDVNGNFISGQYIAPSSRGIDYTYKDDALSVTFRGMSEELDLFSVPNKWVVVRTNAEEAPLKSVYTNSNALSQTSTVSRGRTIVDYREIDNIADQPALDAYTQRIAFEASQIYGKVVFETAIMPMHDYYDILKIEYSALNINDKYTETGWSFPLEVGGRMKHELRKVVNI